MKFKEFVLYQGDITQ